MTNIYYVVSQTEASYVASQKAEGGQLAKCVIRLKVAASLRFLVHEVNGAVYQEVIANDVVKLLNR